MAINIIATVVCIIALSVFSTLVFFAYIDSKMENKYKKVKQDDTY